MHGVQLKSFCSGLLLIKDHKFSYENYTLIKLKNDASLISTCEGSTCFVLSPSLIYIVLQVLTVYVLRSSYFAYNLLMVV